MTGQQLDKALKFMEAGLDGSGYTVRVTLRSGQVFHGTARKHDNAMLPLDTDGAGALVIVIAEIAAIERVPA